MRSVPRRRRLPPWSALRGLRRRRRRGWSARRGSGGTGRPRRTCWRRTGEGKGRGGSRFIVLRTKDEGHQVARQASRKAGRTFVRDVRVEAGGRAIHAGHSSSIAPTLTPASGPRSRTPCGVRRLAACDKDGARLGPLAAPCCLNLTHRRAASAGGKHVHQPCPYCLFLTPVPDPRPLTPAFICRSAELERQAAEAAAASAEAERLAAAEAADAAAHNRERVEWRAAEYLVRLDKAKVRRGAGD